MAINSPRTTSEYLNYGIKEPNVRYAPADGGSELSGFGILEIPSVDRTFPLVRPKPLERNDRESGSGHLASHL